MNDFASFGLSLGDELVLDTEAQQQFPPEHHDEIDNFLQEQQQLSAEDYDCEINNFLQNNLEFPTEDDDEIKNFSFLDSHSAQNEFTNNDKEWFGLLMGLNLPVSVEEADNNTSSEAQPSLSYEELQSTPAFVFPPDNPPLEEEEDDKTCVAGPSCARQLSSVTGPSSESVGWRKAEIVPKIEYKRIFSAI